MPLDMVMMAKPTTNQQSENTYTVQLLSFVEHIIGADKHTADGLTANKQKIKIIEKLFGYKPNVLYEIIISG